MLPTNFNVIFYLKILIVSVCKTSCWKDTDWLLSVLADMSNDISFIESVDFVYHNSNRNNQLKG